MPIFKHEICNKLSSLKKKHTYILGNVLIDCSYQVLSCVLLLPGEEIIVNEIASTRYELPFHEFSFLEMRLEVTDAKIMLLTFCLFGSAAAEAVAA